MEKTLSIITMLLLISSIAFLALATWFLYIEKSLQSLLSLVIGIILLSTSLSLIKEYWTK